MLNTPNILKFCCEEVTRQGHDIDDLGDGFPRVVGMIRAWEHALKSRTYPLTLSDIRIMGRHIEPIHNDGGFRTCNVQIGGKLCPAWEDVPRLMEEWLEHWWDGKYPDLTDDQIYLRFQYIHPFRDGNGRVGKILHNWCSGTLEDPVLIYDYFGGGNP